MVWKNRNSLNYAPSGYISGLHFVKLWLKGEAELNTLLHRVGTFERAAATMVHIKIRHHAHYRACVGPTVILYDRGPHSRAKPQQAIREHGLSEDQVDFIKKKMDGHWSVCHNWLKHPPERNGKLYRKHLALLQDFGERYKRLLAIKADVHEATSAFTPRPWKRPTSSNPASTPLTFQQHCSNQEMRQKRLARFAKPAIKLEPYKQLFMCLGNKSYHFRDKWVESQRKLDTMLSDNAVWEHFARTHRRPRFGV